MSTMKRRRSPSEHKNAGFGPVYWWDLPYEPFKDESGGIKYKYPPAVQERLHRSDAALRNALTDENNYTFVPPPFPHGILRKIVVQDQIVDNRICMYGNWASDPLEGVHHWTNYRDEIKNSPHRYYYLIPELYKEAKSQSSLRSALLKRNDSKSYVE